MSDKPKTEGETIAGQACEIERLKKKIEENYGLYDDEFCDHVDTKNALKAVKLRLAELLRKYEELDASYRNKQTKLHATERELAELKKILYTKMFQGIPEGMDREPGEQLS